MVQNRGHDLVLGKQTTVILAAPSMCRLDSKKNEPQKQQPRASCLPRARFKRPSKICGQIMWALNSAKGDGSEKRIQRSRTTERTTKRFARLRRRQCTRPSKGFSFGRCFVKMCSLNEDTKTWCADTWRYHWGKLDSDYVAA